MVIQPAYIQDVCLVCCRIDVEQFKNVDRQDFLEKYTSLVQRLSLLLLQVRVAGIIW